MQTPSGWYPQDPSDPSLMRYWDGQQWTGHTHRVEQGVGAGGNAVVREGLQLGYGITASKGQAWMRGAETELGSGESVRLLVRGSLAGVGNVLALTEIRLVAMASNQIVHQAMLSDVLRTERDEPSVLLTMRQGWEWRVQSVSLSDLGLVLAYLQEFTTSANLGDRTAALHAERHQRAVDAQRLEDARRGAWGPSTIVVGSRVRSSAAQSILKHARAGEHPWLVIGSLAAGAFAAFDDRVVLVKSGAVTAAMAGAMGGMRVTTFNYRDITGIEYNSGLLSGVLEILTASYNGSANKDFWRGRTRSRNADANDPYTLSNTLPLDKVTHGQALPHLNELRRRIVEVPQVNLQIEYPTAVLSSTHVPPPSAPLEAGTPAAVTEQLQQLAGLHAAGSLTDGEFAEAKRRLLS